MTVQSDFSLLSDGIPMSATLEMAQYDYYTFVYTYGVRASMSVVVAAVSPMDTVSVYVTLDNTIPSVGHYSYKATTGDSGHDGVIMMSKEDSMFLPCTSPSPLGDSSCVVRVAVFNFKVSDADYTLQLTTSRSSSVLRWEQTIRGDVQRGGYVPYSAYLGSSTTNTAVTSKLGDEQDNYGEIIPLDNMRARSDSIRVMIAQLSGHVTAYLSCSTARGGASNQPNMTHHMWILKADDGPSLDIPLIAVADRGCFGAVHASSQVGQSMDSEGKDTVKYEENLIQSSQYEENYLPVGATSGNTTGQTGYLLISVHGDTQASYTLLLTQNTSSSTPVLLTPGVPSLGSVQNKGFLYYTITPGSIYQNMRYTNIYFIYICVYRNRDYTEISNIYRLLIIS